MPAGFTFFLKQGLAMLSRLISKPWAQMILLPQLPAYWIYVCAPLYLDLGFTTYGQLSQVTHQVAKAAQGPSGQLILSRPEVGQVQERVRACLHWPGTTAFQCTPSLTMS